MEEAAISSLSSRLMNKYSKSLNKIYKISRFYFK